ncbi:MAG: hypothetical protein II038_04125 [Lachnospiraceae bacterium]|nr:hypothetical protein [Lachnospiraceae bacterium]
MENMVFVCGGMAVATSELWHYLHHCWFQHVKFFTQLAKETKMKDNRPWFTIFVFWDDYLL